MYKEQLMAVKKALQQVCPRETLAGLDDLMARLPEDPDQAGRIIREQFMTDSALRKAVGQYMGRLLDEMMAEPQTSHPFERIDEGGENFSWEDSLFGGDDFPDVADPEGDMTGLMTEDDLLIPVQRSQRHALEQAAEHMDPVLNLMDKADDFEADDDVIMDQGHGRGEAMFNRVIVAVTRAMSGLSQAALVQMERIPPDNVVLTVAEDDYTLSVTVLRQQERLKLCGWTPTEAVAGGILPAQVDPAMYLSWETRETVPGLAVISAVDYTGGVLNVMALRQRLKTLVERMVEGRNSVNKKDVNKAEEVSHDHMA